MPGDAKNSPKSIILKENENMSLFVCTKGFQDPYRKGNETQRFKEIFLLCNYQKISFQKNPASKKSKFT